MFLYPVNQKFFDSLLNIFSSDKFKNGFIVAVIDCTGHGVPGAFMTMLASSSLRRITIDEQCMDPGKILKRLNSIVKKSLQQDSEHVISDDGLDASICFVDIEKKIMTFAGARLSLSVIQSGGLTTVKGDRKSIGYRKSELDFEFTNHEIVLENNMLFYLYTDGVTDQLGGAKRIPFGRKRFNHRLLDNRNKSFTEQKEEIITAFNQYKGDNEIQDDVTVIGFKVET